MLTYRSPTNHALRGVAQYDNGIWPVRFGVDGDRAADFTFTQDGPDVEWETTTAADSALFVDETGQEWLAHHLIAADTDVAGGEVIALPHTTVAKLLREVALAQALEAAKIALKHARTAEKLVDPDDAVSVRLFFTVTAQAREAVEAMQRSYDVANRHAVDAMLEAL